MTKKLVNLTGQTFGNWTVLSQVPKQGSHTKWLCSCRCGTVKTVHAVYLKQGKSKSCGCLMPAMVGNAIRTHGRSTTPLYFLWVQMKRRCYNPKQKAYPLYGGRGIKVCERWHQFENFLADMGERPKGKTLDRTNNDGDYSPENCRWETPKQQRSNQRVRVTDRMISFRGKTMPIRAWAREMKVDHSLISRRLERGLSVEQALTLPNRAAKKRLALASSLNIDPNDNRMSRPRLDNG